MKKSRNRSTSITNAVVSNKAPVVVPTKSTTSSSTSNSVKRSSSLNEKPKKSLLGSLFGRKLSSSSKTKPTIIPPKLKPIKTTSTVASKLISETLKEPNSPDVNMNSQSTIISTPLGDSTASSPQVFQSSSSSSTSSNEKLLHSEEKLAIQKLSSIKLKRVTFAVDKFEADPAQQLPSRTPKQGNVLVPDDMISEVPSISMGISANTPQSTKTPSFSKNSKEYRLALENQRFAIKEAEKHQKEAHFAAKRIADEVANFKATSSEQKSSIPVTLLPSTTAADSELNEKINNIDKPIHVHEHHFEQEISTGEVTLDIVYTRCCHLREILPIPSTLRQVKGKTAPLQTLKFLNPKPTLIDILSFCDFISIVPINTIIFDNVSLTSEMFKIIISSVVKSTVLEKLGLRNVIIDKENWKLLCKFMLNNKSIVKLDISQTKIRTESNDLENIYRHNMDWELFANVLQYRLGKPLEEILLNGIKFNNIPVHIFKDLLHSISSQRNATSVGIRVGLATSDISLDCLKAVMNWISANNVQGVDLSFNDLAAFVKPLVGKLSSLTFPNLEYFTLNNTNISSSYDVALILKYLCKLPNLKFLDLSNLPQIYPDVLPYMYKYLPRFPQLKRIHFDNNNLSFKELTVVCNILLKCHSLAHVSMLSQLQSPTAAASDSSTNVVGPESQSQFARNNLWATLYALAKDSPNLVGLDIDYDRIPEEIQQRIALCLMRNMNRAMDSTFQLDELASQDDLLFDGTLITETAEDVLTKLNKLNENTSASTDKKDVTKRYLLKKYLEKLHRVHFNTQHKIDCMFEKRNSGELTLQEKENLLRLLLLEKNLSNLMEILGALPQVSSVLGSNKEDSMQPVYQQSQEGSTVTSGTSSESVSSVVLKHVESVEPIVVPPETRPHLMATDSGRTVDVLTGKPVLFRRGSSSTSVVGKKQIEEEGELHKWGYFVQQQCSIYPENEVTKSKETVNPPTPTTPTTASTSTTSTATHTPTPTTSKTPIIIVPKIPSGTELRKAIIKAKGIDSIDDLIQNVNQDEDELINIYGKSVQPKLNHPTGKLVEDDISSITRITPKTNTPAANGNTAPHITLGAKNVSVTTQEIDTSEDNCEKNCEQITEAYDKLLNNLSIKRPGKA